MAPRDALWKSTRLTPGSYSSDDINLENSAIPIHWASLIHSILSTLGQILLIANILLRSVASRDADIERNGHANDNEDRTLSKHAPAAEFLGSLDSGGRLLDWVDWAGNGNIGDDELLVFVCSAQSKFCTAVNGSSWIDTRHHQHYYINKVKALLFSAVEDTRL